MTDNIKRADSAADYHNSEYLGRSQLFKMSKSPEHFKYALENPQEPTPALLFGIAFHMLVLEPERFETEYGIMPKIDKRTRVGREMFEKISKEKSAVINEDDFEILQEMADSIKRTKYAETLLNGEHEQSYYWTDEMTGIKVKCRPDCRRDLKNGRGLIVDLKTCESAATEDFMRDAIKYGYDLQAAQYKTGVELIENKPHDFVFIAVEKKPPYAVNILQADNLFIQRGYDIFRTYLGMVKECRETNNWWGYNGSAGYINNLYLPSWLMKEME